MPQCVVIADDLTGANATGVLLKKMNYKAYTVMNTERIELSTLSDCDCVLYPTDSRGVDAEIAYNRVHNVCSLLKGDEVKVYAKRIDSTLRGNLGSETDAMLDCLGEDYVAIVAPCFPSSGRIVIGGYMLVDGIPLHKTNIAIDPKTPVKVSEAAVLFREQSKYQVSSILMKDLMHGKHYLADLMNKCVAEGSRILVIDCVTQEDLDLIADAAIRSKLKVVTVDPGVFTATLSRKLIVPSEKKEKNKILAVVGSVNPNTTVQMEELWLSQRTHNVFVNTKELLEGDERREQEIARVTRLILEECDRNVVSTVTGDGIYPENRIDFKPYMKQYECSLDKVTGMINSAFAEITYRIFKSEPTFKGLYTSGGDVTVAVCEKFQTAGLSLMDEVLPLAAYGQFLKGEFEGVHIITKGGSQGGRDAINRCITYLKEKLYI
ncbi:four-carbon acid sugar kinase family protein [Bariatricus sp. SGI.154]|uniref:four-carbon acid sugar kinase family protein n=1 Tax=Bariatricus sp. SGI.154 TaxID=3420549 RepID=UPI003D069906